MMRDSHRAAGIKPAIAAAGLVTGVMLGSALSAAPGPALATPAAGTSSQPSAPESVGLMAIVIVDHPGPSPGPPAVTAT